MPGTMSIWPWIVPFLVQLDAKTARFLTYQQETRCFA
jgi:hypothetical protein